MKKKLAIFLITFLVAACSAKAEYDYGDIGDYTGEAFFVPTNSSSNIDKAIREAEGTSSESGVSSSGLKGTIPPLKKWRLNRQYKKMMKMQSEMQHAPTAADTYKGEVETSEYASKEVVDDFADMPSDGFESDIEKAPSKRGLFKKNANASKSAEDEGIILDCDNVDYDTPNYLIYARGNVSVEFVKQKTTVKADVITFDRINNTIKAEGDVKILKNDNVITGDYIFVDLNDENALIENPCTEMTDIVIKAKKGYVYGDKITQENGTIVVDKPYLLDFQSAKSGPLLRRMILPKEENLSSDIEKGKVRFVARDIKINQKGDLETIAIKKGRVYKGGRTVFKVPAVKLYTNRNHDYGESNIWEIGSYRGLGLYTGPGWVFELPKGSVLKAMPILNYKSGLGIGALGRFSSGTNRTMIGYGTAQSKVVAYGKQDLDDDLFLQYSINGYMDGWFMGSRRPKYGIALDYDKTYSAQDFLLKGHYSSFRHRLEAGYFQDLDFDGKYEKIKGGNIGTTRFRYMAMARQNLFNYEDRDKQKSFIFDMNAQLAASVYGTGDTQIVGRLGPLLHTQYKRWMQDVGYFYSAYEDNSPMPLFDAYRYGKQNLYFREYLRLCRWLTVSWFASVNLTNDAPNHRTFQENGFYFSLGPDDLKFSIGYDLIRQTMRCYLNVMMDVKGAKVEYDTLEITQSKKASKRAPVAPTNNAYQAPEQPKVLQRAVVEDIKVMEEVL